MPWAGSVITLPPPSSAIHLALSEAMTTNYETRRTPMALFKTNKQYTLQKFIQNLPPTTRDKHLNSEKKWAQANK